MQRKALPSNISMKVVFIISLSVMRGLKFVCSPYIPQIMLLAPESCLYSIDQPRAGESLKHRLLQRRYSRDCCPGGRGGGTQHEPSLG